MTNASDRAIKIFPASILIGEFGLPVKKIMVMEKVMDCQLWDTAGK